MAVSSPSSDVASVSTVRAEFTVEPFTGGAPGPHVEAAVAAARVGGLEPQVGAFATAVSGPTEVVAEAVRALTAAAFAQGATRVTVTVEAE
jgi:uncharacterized protein YqgV (UPF0045/DUF77 family)